MCPFDESVCGPSHLIYPEASGVEYFITASGNEKSTNFIFGEVCSYQLEWPEEAVEGHSISLKLGELDGGMSAIYVAHGTGFDQAEKLEEVELSEVGQILTIAYPS